MPSSLLPGVSGRTEMEITIAVVALLVLALGSLFLMDSVDDYDDAGWRY